MDQGADGSGCFHCIRQPGLEGELGGFGSRSHQETISQHCQRASRDGRRAGKQGIDVIAARCGDQQNGSQQQPNTAELGYDQRLHTACHRFGIIIVEGNQGIGTKSGNFPEDKHQQQVARQHQTNHCTNEEQDKGVIASQLVFAVHVIDGENHGKRTNNRGNYRQENAQSISNKGEITKNAAHWDGQRSFLASASQQNHCRHTRREGKCHGKGMLNFFVAVPHHPDHQCTQPG